MKNYYKLFESWYYTIVENGGFDVRNDIKDILKENQNWKELLSIYDPLTFIMAKKLYVHGFALMQNIKERIVREFHRNIFEKVFLHREYYKFNTIKKDLESGEWFYKLLSEVVNNIKSYDEPSTTIDILNYDIVIKKAELLILIASIGFFYPCIDLPHYKYNKETTEIIKRLIYHQANYIP